MNKTNAMRMLDKAKIQYEAKTYIPDENDLSGTHVAGQVGLEPDMVFKTLTAKGDKTGVVVFCIPSNRELDLKKAAKISQNKSVELLHVKDLLGVTGYIRGGCSPIGMKKSFPTYIDKTALDFEKITISAGVKGCQLLLKSEELIKFVNAKCEDLTLKA